MIWARREEIGPWLANVGTSKEVSMATTESERDRSERWSKRQWESKSLGLGFVSGLFAAPPNQILLQ